MKKVFFGVVLSSLILLVSCSNEGKAVDEYCNCMNTILNDSLIDASNINELNKSCYDSIIINKYKMEEDAEFIAKFDSIQEVKDVVVKRKSTIIKNVDKILQSYSFEYEDILGNEKRAYLFDGKMFTQILYQIQYFGAGWSESKRWTGTYKTEVEPNGKAYVTISMNGENDIYQLRKSSKDGYNLKGRRTLWQEDK